MAGGMFAGHDECGGETIEKNGKKYKLFYGMSSNTAMKKHAGGVADYRYIFLFTMNKIYKTNQWHDKDQWLNQIQN